MHKGSYNRDIASLVWYSCIVKMYKKAAGVGPPAAIAIAVPIEDRTWICWTSHSISVKGGLFFLAERQHCEDEAGK
jgi:hypothetical protein